MSATLYDDPVFRVAGDQGMLMEFGDGIAYPINQRVMAMTMAMDEAQLDGVTEIVPTYRSVVVTYNPLKISFNTLKETLLSMSREVGEVDLPYPEIVDIPVCYGGEWGPDLEFVAASHGLSAQEVIRQHSEADYLVFMLGFTPGFPFLGGLPESLHTPRLETPRTRVPAGSVGIANGQTGVYPIDSPGGWQLIGRVPVKIFDPQRENPFLIKAGNLLKFRPVSEEEYNQLTEKS